MSSQYGTGRHLSLLREALLEDWVCPECLSNLNMEAECPSCGYFAAEEWDFDQEGD